MSDNHETLQQAILYFAEWQDYKLIDVRVGNVGRDIERGKKYRLIAGEFTEVQP